MFFPINSTITIFHFLIWVSIITYIYIKEVIGITDFINIKIDGIIYFFAKKVDRATFFYIKKVTGITDFMFVVFKTRHT